MTTCFDCAFRNIHEVRHEDIECHCKFDGRWHNPYRPKTFYDKDCENWKKIGEDENDQGRKDSNF